MKAWGMPKVLGFRYDAGIRLVVKAGEEIELPENIMRELIKAFGDTALADARKQEREAAKGLVEALERWALLADLSEQPPHKAYPDAVQQAKLVRNHLEHTLSLLATYREKSGEKV
jgi:hypothetical protein